MKEICRNKSNENKISTPLESKTHSNVRRTPILDLQKLEKSASCIRVNTVGFYWQGHNKTVLQKKNKKRKKKKNMKKIPLFEKFVSKKESNGFPR